MQLFFKNDLVTSICLSTQTISELFFYYLAVPEIMIDAISEVFRFELSNCIFDIELDSCFLKHGVTDFFYNINAQWSSYIGRG